MRAITLRAALVLCGLAALNAPAATADPLFGPATYERTSGSPDVYSDNIAAPVAGTYALWVLNGDSGGSRVSSGNIVVNTRTVASDSDFSKNVWRFVKPVALAAGNNSLTVTLAGEPGSFITVLVTRSTERPDLTQGRLLIPYATSAELGVDLKNGSHRHPRRVRLVFYDAAGSAVAASGRVLLDPRASLRALASSLLAEGAWTEGSVEIFYVGHGPGRVFGQAVIADPATSDPSIVPIQQAGYRRVDPYKQTD